jgi:hypothetical protein
LFTGSIIQPLNAQYIPFVNFTNSVLPMLSDNTLPLPNIDLRVVITYSAETLSITMTTTIAPDVKYPTFFAKRLFASIAQNNSLIDIAYLANHVFSDCNH